MLKVLNLELCNTETHMKPLSCVAQHGQKVKSNNSCSRTPSPPNQLSIKQPEPPVTSQSQYEGLPDFPGEAATLSSYSACAVPVGKGRKVCNLVLKTPVYLLHIALDCWNGEKVANRKHQGGLQVQLLHHQDTVIHRGSTLVNHSWFKSFFQCLRAWNTDKRQLLNILDEHGCPGTCMAAEFCTRAARRLRQSGEAGDRCCRWRQSRNTVFWLQLTTRVLPLCKLYYITTLYFLLFSDPIKVIVSN